MKVPPALIKPVRQQRAYSFFWTPDIVVAGSSWFSFFSRLTQSRSSHSHTPCLIISSVCLFVCLLNKMQLKLTGRKSGSAGGWQDARARFQKWTHTCPAAVECHTSEDEAFTMTVEPWMQHVPYASIKLVLSVVMNDDCRFLWFYRLPLFH